MTFSNSRQSNELLLDIGAGTAIAGITVAIPDFCVLLRAIFSAIPVFVSL